MVNAIIKLNVDSILIEGNLLKTIGKALPGHNVIGGLLVVMTQDGE